MKRPVDRARELGLPILGEADERCAPGGVVVCRRFTHPNVQRLADEGYRVNPSGPKHAIVEPPRVAKP